MKNVIPYVVDATFEIDKSEKIISFSSINLDLYQHGVRLPDQTKSISECELRDVFFTHDPEAPAKLRHTYVGLFSSDCDGSLGQSGGAILRDDAGSPPILLGIHQGSPESYEQLMAARRSGRLNHAEYDRMNWSNRHVALRGPFLSAVMYEASK